jgi:hypothetical protein
LFVPDSEWQRFRSWHTAGSHNSAEHVSFLVAALHRGHVNRLTSSVHRFLITDGLVRKEVRSQYLEDLRERWMYADDPFERHDAWRRFFGKVCELQIAELFEQRGLEVTALEAYREGPDIELSNVSGERRSIEVKFLGPCRKDFASVLSAISSGFGRQFGAPYEAANYLLFRAYEGARQLRTKTEDRQVVIVIEDWRGRTMK